MQCWSDRHAWETQQASDIHAQPIVVANASETTPDHLLALFKVGRAEHEGAFLQHPLLALPRTFQRVLSPTDCRDCRPGDDLVLHEPEEGSNPLSGMGLREDLVSGARWEVQDEVSWKGRILGNPSDMCLPSR